MTPERYLRISNMAARRVVRRGNAARRVGNQTGWYTSLQWMLYAQAQHCYTRIIRLTDRINDGRIQA